MNPQTAADRSFAAFDPQAYDPAKAPVLYRPGLYGVAPLSVTPRFGFALDVFGQGKTVLRGGAGCSSIVPGSF